MGIIVTRNVGIVLMGNVREMMVIALKDVKMVILVLDVLVNVPVVVSEGDVIRKMLNVQKGVERAGMVNSVLSNVGIVLAGDVISTRGNVRHV